jgi:hypothetical protein
MAALLALLILMCVGPALEAPARATPPGAPTGASVAEAPADAAPSSAQPPSGPAPAPRFDARRALATLAEIAGDDFAGRKSGLASGRRIEEYVAGRFASWGLEPAGENGSYFHTFPMLVTEERGAELELLDSPYGEIGFLYGNDFALVTNSGSADVTAEVVIAGHGLCDLDREWDDYGDTDVSGKIVLIFRGAPENGYDWEQATARDSTLHEAVRRGAAGVLYVQESRPVYGGAVHEGSYFPAVPVAYVGHHVADLLFMDTGIERETYEKGLSSTPHPLATGKRMRFVTEVIRLPDGSARNVVGRIDGSDPRLRDEVIIIGGHMDHIGTDGRGLVFNGADDNGSGTAVVIELARVFAESPAPRRTIIFTTIAAEEQGLLGSKAFAEHPPFDLSPVVAMINFDMTGYGTGKTAIGGGEQYPAVMHAFRASLDSTVAESLLVRRAWGGEGSDHAPFRRAGIPTGNIWTQGEHHFYHQLEDDFAWIDSTALGGAGRMAERWIRFLADWPEPLAGEHMAGRALLYDSYQIDFDGAPAGTLPHYVAGGVRWFDAERFADGRFLDAVDRLARGSGTDTLALVDRLSGVQGAAREGKRACLIGLHQGETPVPAERIGLLGDLHVSLMRGVEPDAIRDTAQLAKERVSFLASPDTAWVSVLPRSGEVCLRVFANRGEEIRDPHVYPRLQFFFIVSLDAPMAAPQLARMLARIGWDRLHLDLVPWIKRGGEEQICAFLEELQVAGPFEQRQMRAMLGGNIGRW